MTLNSSCNKDLNIKVDEHSNKIATYRSGVLSSAERDSLMVNFAKTLASAQNNLAFMQYLEASLKNAPNESETVLLIEFATTTIGSSSTTVAEHLASHASLVGLNHSAAYFLDTLLPAIPNLTITIHPGEVNNLEIDDWNYTSMLNVIPITEAFDHHLETFNVAYDGSLQTSLHSNFVEPYEPILIVQADPFVILLDSVTGEIITGPDILFEMLEDCEELEMEIQNLINELGITVGVPLSMAQWNIILLEIQPLIALYNEICASTEDDGPGEGTAGQCDRDGRECKEAIPLMKWQGPKAELNIFCPWSRKTCLFYVFQTFADYDPNSNKAVYGAMPHKSTHHKRKFLKNNGAMWNPGITLEWWRYLDGTHGDQYRIDLLGKNPKSGDTKKWGISFAPKVKFKISGVEVEVNFFSTTYEHTITQKDAQLGGFLVTYCDDANPPGGEQYWQGTNWWMHITEQYCN